MKKSTAILILVKLFILLMFSGCKNLDEIVTFTDPMLEKTVRKKIGKPAGELNYRDVNQIESLTFGTMNKKF